MSQELKFNNQSSDTSVDQMASEPWSAETYADKLMDDLFSDLDQILDTPGKVPDQPIQPTYISLQEIKVAEVTMPPAVIQNPPLSSVAKSSTTGRKKLKKLALAPVSPNQKTVKSKWSFGEYLEKIIWIVTFLSLVGTLVLWLVHEKKINWLSPLNNTLGQKAQLSQTDQEFIKYMMESLENMDRTSKPTQQKQSKNSSNQQQTLNNQKSTSPTPIVIQPQIYIPYPNNLSPTVPLDPKTVIPPTSQPVEPKSITPQSVVPQPSTTAYFITESGSIKSVLPQYLMPNTMAVNSPMPKSKPLGLFKTIPFNLISVDPIAIDPLQLQKEVAKVNKEKQQSKVGETRKNNGSKSLIGSTKERRNIVARNNNNDSIILPVPVIPQSSNTGYILPKIMPPQIIEFPDKTNNSAIINNPNAAILSNNSSNTYDQNKYTLTGLLQLGDQSVALFEINGTNQRIKPGESIGNSGWNIVSISSQEVVIRRNGEIRAVYVGQKF